MGYAGELPSALPPLARNPFSFASPLTSGLSLRRERSPCTTRHARSTAAIATCRRAMSRTSTRLVTSMQSSAVYKHSKVDLH
jgi:hypothetical protein